MNSPFANTGTIKLYSAKYMSEHNLKFPQTWMDDFPFVLSFIRDVEKVVFTPKPYYHFLRARAELPSG